ncbi:MAG TPA: hypothetical protein VN426_13870 [Syntrophomonadaceae bacterium]|nr:hypothetical protein [Syntrophomonadaceae bacterium]
MDGQDQKLRKIYDETASLFVDLSLRGQVTVQEMHFLLNLLDQVVVKGRNPRLLEALGLWQPETLDPELNEIIKATLLALDFQDQEDIADLAQLIRDLCK